MSLFTAERFLGYFLRWFFVSCMFVSSLQSMEQGARNPSLSVLANEDQTVWGWKRTCNFPRDGTWLTQEPPCRFQTICFQFSRVARFSQSVKVGTIWLSWKGSVSSQFFVSSIIGYDDGTFLILSRVHLPTPFLSVIIGVFLHVRCIPHQNSQRLFWASVCCNIQMFLGFSGIDVQMIQMDQKCRAGRTNQALRRLPAVPLNLRFHNCNLQLLKSRTSTLEGSPPSKSFAFTTLTCSFGRKSRTNALFSQLQLTVFEGNFCPEASLSQL